MGTLFLVATPIGNLEDISSRALNTLKQVRLIACEDTRRSRKMLSHFQINTPVTSYYEHNKYTKLNYILEQLALGDIALISDAGTPAVNDPGYELVVSALRYGHTVSPIPGPSAPIAALAASGLPTDAFLYLGYLPRKTNERRQRLSQMAEYPFTLIFLEVPHRILACLRDMSEILGNRKIAIARELTKIHEEIIRGDTDTVLAHFKAHEPRGEFTLVVEASPQPQNRWSENDLNVWIKEALARGLSAKQIAKAASEISGWPRRQIYSVIQRWRDEERTESTHDAG
ncbi:MAG: 16S rRNA (cytidine(1402)-2'-O)-methyltransferase [Anaerolineales bacterium]|nr:16S rRNA (cytidine(1402)-2'-O)-methyltransferase [Anaerolineales bacterium]